MLYDWVVGDEEVGPSDAARRKRRARRILWRSVMRGLPWYSAL